MTATSKIYGILSIVGAIVFAFTVSRLGIIGILCFLITVLGFRHLIKEDTKWTKIFFRIVVICLIRKGIIL